MREELAKHRASREAATTRLIAELTRERDRALELRDSARDLSEQRMQRIQKLEGQVAAIEHLLGVGDVMSISAYEAVNRLLARIAELEAENDNLAEQLADQNVLRDLLRRAGDTLDGSSDCCDDLLREIDEVLK